MARRIFSRGLYNTTPAGVLVPSGKETEAHSFEKSSVFAIKLDAVKLFEIFRLHGLEPTRSPSLAKLLTKTAGLSEALLTAGDTSHEQIFASLQLQRIVDAVMPMAEDPALPRLLAELLDGTVDLLARTQSKAKDTLWELELLQSMRANGVQASLGEPDLLLATSHPPTGVACKKIYSEENVSKVLSKGVRQISESSAIGIVALNLDDLLPEGCILNAADAHGAAQLLDTRIHQFMARHERHLRRYIEPGRAIAVLASCAALADLQQSRPQFCNYRQTVVWHVPEVSQEVEKSFRAVLDAFTHGSLAA
jgi:hypothetical protein